MEKFTDIIQESDNTFDRFVIFFPIYRIYFSLFAIFESSSGETKIILFYLFSRSSEEKNLRLDNFLLMQITENRIRNEINCAQTQLFGDGRREIS